ncbi:MAG: bifunctional 3,4-dihydroxy-2-butanone-4-phosphate synthase/GTP cyclohydrolase II [Phycisphaerae bacterium]|nr:bifunctional 3,4-dihydroxy-2-butanone-4-phosphate synthase/GTP cyclohydrolase II [Phycisphaerae bacterium]
MFCTTEEAIEEFKQGNMVIVVDDERRENEGDLFCAAECVTPEIVNFMLRYARGVLCLALTREHCERLNLTPQVSENTAPHGTAFQVFIDAAPAFGVVTGESARERAITIRRAVDPQCRPLDLVRPGHVPPLRARTGGVLVRAGHTEAAVDFARLAGMEPAAVICPILAENGDMARVPDLQVFAREHQIKMCTIADLIEYRQRREKLIDRGETIALPTRFGNFTLIAYKSNVDPDPHLALCCGGVGEQDKDGRPIVHTEPVLVRVHSECLTGDVFGSARCDCGDQLSQSLEMIQAAGKGALIYLRQEGRGIGLHNKLKAYKLQDGGMDTVEANEALGFPADKRDYGIGAQILLDLGLRKLRILTNNPKKLTRLEVYGVEIVEQVPLQIAPTETNRRYLATKKSKLGHLLDGL